MKNISVILCCHNGAQRLRPTLDHLAKQRFSVKLSWELVFVDNASTDGSADFVRQLWTEMMPVGTLKVVAEPQTGLIHARRAGIVAAEGDLVVFCDDDNWLQDDYLQIAYNRLSDHPEYGAVGGRGIAVADMPLPAEWAEWEGDYACGRIAAESCVCDYRRSLFGAGLATRRALMQKVFAAPFVLCGRQGTVLTSGDDSEICDRIMLAGYHLYYEERLVFQHYMPNERLTDAYHRRLLQGFEQMYGLLEHYSAAIVYGRMTRWQLLQELCRRIGSVLLRHNGRSLYKLKLFMIHGLGLMCFADDIARQIRKVQKIMK